jgi:hypothetical protein
MSITTFTHRFFELSTLVTAFLLTLALLLQSGCQRSSQENVSNANSNANLGQTNVQTSPSEAAKSMTQDPLADNLILVMKDWSGMEVAKLERSSPLSSMWTFNHAPSRPYDPQGIDSLIGKIRGSSYFKSAPRVKDRVQQLQRGFFVVGGGIQNQGQLYDFLAL